MLIYLFWLCWVLVAACGIQFSDRDWIHAFQHWEHRVSATGPPGKSPDTCFNSGCTPHQLCDFRGLKDLSTPRDTPHRNGKPSSVGSRDWSWDWWSWLIERVSTSSPSCLFQSLPCASWPLFLLASLPVARALRLCGGRVTASFSAFTFHSSSSVCVSVCVFWSLWKRGKKVRNPYWSAESGQRLEFSSWYRHQSAGSVLWSWTWRVCVLGPWRGRQSVIKCRLPSLVLTRVHWWEWGMPHHGSLSFCAYLSEGSSWRVWEPSSLRYHFCSPGLLPPLFPDCPKQGSAASQSSL